jgi:mRNA-degrading endonuclease RelE of RelBE toxin-antitoxin system
MSYQIKVLNSFYKELKPLAKKYKSLKKDLSDFENDLLENPFLGTPIGKNCYKVRIKISSKSSGKSGGARIITFVKIQRKTVYLLSIYDKSEKENISDSELLKSLKEINTI